MPYGHSNPLTKEKIAERIERLEAVAGVLVAQLCHDTADMLRQILPTFGGRRAFQSICAEPLYATTDCFTIEIHTHRRAMGEHERLAEWLTILRMFGDYLVDCQRGDRKLTTPGSVEIDGNHLIFARMLQGAEHSVPGECFTLVKQELPF
jgi:hypothetical protein